MLVVVAYDVADDTRRTRLHTLLLGYGDPVQESLFECEVTERQRRTLRRRVARTIVPAVDRVRYYLLCRDCAAMVEDATSGRRATSAEVFMV